MRGVPSARYPLNATTSHPTNDAEATEAHHCFPRSQQIGDSWFVEIAYDTKKEAKEQAELFGVKATEITVIIPHVTGLTMEEHTRVEMHDAKIVIEDGVFVWYDRTGIEGIDYEAHDMEKYAWTKVGPLNPQPGSREGKPKTKRRVKKEGEKLRDRGTWQVRVPKDEVENGANLLDEYIDNAREVLIELEAPGVNADSPTYQIVMPVMAAGYAALSLEAKARRKAAREERARKKAEKAAA